MDQTEQSSLTLSQKRNSRPASLDVKEKSDMRFIESSHITASRKTVILNDIIASLNVKRAPDFVAFLSEMEFSTDPISEDEFLRVVLTKWAGFDGSTAASWVMERQAYRHFLPEILQAWARNRGESAAAAWALAKEQLALDGDESVWLSDDFLKTVFCEMTAVLGDDIWNEMAALPRQASISAMIGIATFASYRQDDTAYAAGMEERVLNHNSPAIIAAFYAGAGHITAAKAELPLVTDKGQWHIIVREIARQQAVGEPRDAILWLESQFVKPTDAISDMVTSIGMMHSLNGGDVIQWLETLPSSELRADGITKIRSAFPELSKFNSTD